MLPLVSSPSARSKPHRHPRSKRPSPATKQENQTDAKKAASDGGLLLLACNCCVQSLDCEEVASFSTGLREITHMLELLLSQV
jgi:hypothetical protein